MNVIKRDGRSVPFDKSKIVRAITLAMQRTKDGVDEQIVQNISDKIEAAIWDNAQIETIQDMIERALMASRRKDVAQEYIRYRERRTIYRRQKSKFMGVIQNKLNASNVQNQNANVDERSFGGRKGEAADELMRQHALDFCMSEMSKRNHLNNEIYIHDLNSYSVGMHNCLSIPFDKLLANGFTTKQVDIRPANSINTAFQLVAVIFQIQSLQQFGGCSATHLDWTMVPYVRKSYKKHLKDGFVYVQNKPYVKELIDDEFEVPINYPLFQHEYPNAYRYALDMTRKELKQAVEGMYHNLNSLQSRSGNQLPFSSINYGTCILPQGRMVTKALLDGSINGVGKNHDTPIFPCGIFQMMQGVNRHKGAPNYDLYLLATRSTAKRLYPNYANVDWSGNAGYDRNDPRTYFSTMGCRTANGWDVNGFGQLKDGRGNICPVTIIMPTLAMEARVKEAECEDGKTFDLVNEFMSILDQKIHEAKDMLIERFEYICSQPMESARFMYQNGTMEGYVPEEGIRSALKHGTLAVGNIGLAETLQILIGKDHTTPQGMVLAKKIYQLFKDRCAEFKEAYKLNFGVYNTPAQNLCYTAMKKFKARFGEIPNVSDRDYFTNSMHVPVWYHMSPFDKIDIESELTGYSSAGCITYVQADGTVRSKPEAIQSMVDYAMDHDIPYFAINLPIDTCNKCGYTDDIPEDKCPKCGCTSIRRLRRVTGYLTGDYKSAFNPGKQAQVEDRFKHTSIK